jgi:hypothetical protein
LLVFGDAVIPPLSAGQLRAWLQLGQPPQRVSGVCPRADRIAADREAMLALPPVLRATGWDYFCACHDLRHPREGRVNAAALTVALVPPFNETEVESAGWPTMTLRWGCRGMDGMGSGAKTAARNVTGANPTASSSARNAAEAPSALPSVTSRRNRPSARNCSGRFALSTMTGSARRTAVGPRAYWAVVGLLRAGRTQRAQALAESLLPDGPRQVCVAAGSHSTRGYSSNDLSRAQFVPNTARNCGHSRLAMVSLFLCI